MHDISHAFRGSNALQDLKLVHAQTKETTGTGRRATSVGDWTPMTVIHAYVW